MTDPKPVTSYVYLRREVRQYMERAATSLRVLYPHYESVRTEWMAMIREETVYDPPRRSSSQRMYAPVVDIAVGPFAMQWQCVQEYDHLMDTTSAFLEILLTQHQQNIRLFDSFYHAPSLEQLKITNQNSRCFLAIEVEKGNPDAKYLMGSMVNAAALGRIGIVVAWDHTRLQQLFRMREYVQFLDELKKNTFDTTNVLLLDKDQFLQAIESVLFDEHPCG